MTSLGDFFPQGNKEHYALTSIKKGSVIKCFVHNTIPPKEKRFIVLGTDNNNNYIGVIFINSKINFNVNINEELISLQYIVKKEDNEYLDRDSYVDCSKLISLEYELVKNAIIEKPTCVLGTVKNNDMESICARIMASPIVSQAQLELFGLI